jgi:deoxycytidylate deaminase
MPPVPGWDRHYLEICRVVAKRSMDPSAQVGCVIVGPAHEIRATLSAP